MHAFVKEITWSPYLSHGWGNGYVVIPKGHPLYNKDFRYIDVDVHGGLTFAESANLLGWPELTDEDKGGWVVGFSTTHLGDSLDNWPESAVMKEAIRLKEQLESYTHKN